MGRVLRWLMYVIGALVVLVLLAGVGIVGNAWRVINARVDNPVPAVTVASSPAVIERGRYLATTFSNCVGCHSSNPAASPPVLDGGILDAAPLAVLYPPNLTPTNLGTWSDGEVLRAIREGVGRDGRPLLVMPSNNFKNLSDDDAQSIVAYLRTQPPTASQTRPHNIMPLGYALIGTGQVSPSNQPPVSGVQAPPRGPTPDYGRYLVQISDCRDCHGPNLDALNLPPGPPPGPNLRVVKGWTEEQFMRVFREGINPSGKVLSAEMPWQAFGQGTPDDLRAIYQYLQSLP